MNELQQKISRNFEIFKVRISLNKNSYYTVDRFLNNQWVTWNITEDWNDAVLMALQHASYNYTVFLNRLKENIENIEKEL